MINLKIIDFVDFDIDDSHVKELSHQTGEKLSFTSIKSNLQFPIMIRFLSSLLLVTFCLGATSCISKVEKRGYMFDLSDHELLQEGITSKERVLKIMGSPTLISDLNQDEAWIYYFENVKQLLFFLPKIEERTVMVLRFDEYGVIKELKSLSLEDQDSKLVFATNYTAVDSHEVGFFKSIFSNVGQIKPQ